MTHINKNMTQKANLILQIFMMGIFLLCFGTLEAADPYSPEVIQTIYDQPDFSALKNSPDNQAKDPMGEQRNNHLHRSSVIDLALDHELLEYCTDDQLGVRILCNPDWEIEEGENAVLMIISSEPAVTVTLVKIDEQVHFLEQLTRDHLEVTGQYAEGFERERTFLGSKSTVKIKAFSKDYPEMRLLDYYFIYNSNLYGLLFSVNPKEQWDDYKFLIQKLAQSFEFISKPAYKSNFNGLQGSIERLE